MALGPLAHALPAPDPVVQSSVRAVWFRLGSPFACSVVDQDTAKDKHRGVSCAGTIRNKGHIKLSQPHKNFFKRSEYK